jgi:outer membrane immunogenic protein
VGYLISPSFLWYATGGLAYGETKLLNAFYGNTFVPPAASTHLTDNTQLGWTVGAGVEWRFAPQWSVKAEWAPRTMTSFSLDRRPLRCVGHFCLLICRA